MDVVRLGLRRLLWVQGGRRNCIHRHSISRTTPFPGIGPRLIRGKTIEDFELCFL